MSIDLRCDGVSKRYRIRRAAEGGGAARALLGRLGVGWRGARDFWALRDVSFTVRRGEVLGIVGRNGAGKSTLFKLLSRITAPSEGRIEIRGRLSALIEVGSGFHPELTGRENVDLSGSILGMTRRQIRANLEGIIEFAGVAEFIDVPVKRYSSGMAVRLGFSIAAHLDPDVLLLDEVLAVGDAAFQTKCFERLHTLRRSGTTIVFISHDLGAVERLCDRALLMEAGRIVAEGTPREVIARYSHTSAEEGGGGRPAAEGAPPAAVARVSFHDATGRETTSLRTGEPFRARVEYLAREAVAGAILELRFRSPDGQLQCELTTEPNDLDLAPGIGVIDFMGAGIALRPGMYVIDALIGRMGPLGGRALDLRAHCAMLRVDGAGRPVQGLFHMPHSWAPAVRSSANGRPPALM